MASIYESVVSILKQPVTPKGTTVRDTLVESNGLARPTKNVESINEAARYHAGQRVTGKYRSGTGHYTIDHVVKGTEDSSDPEYVVTQHDNHVSASGKKEPKKLKHRQSDLHATNEDQLDELSPVTLRDYIRAAGEDAALRRGEADFHRASLIRNAGGDKSPDTESPTEKRNREQLHKRLHGVHIASGKLAHKAMANEDYDDSILESVEFNALIESTAEVLSEAASRKDYVAVAKLIHDAASAPDDSFESPAHAVGYRRAVKHLGVALADRFAHDNPRFDRDRFHAASGLDKMVD